MGSITNAFGAEDDPHALLRDLQHSPCTPTLVHQLAEYLHEKQHRSSRTNAQTQERLLRKSINHPDISRRLQHCTYSQNLVYPIPQQNENPQAFDATQGGLEQESATLHQTPRQLPVAGRYNVYSQNHAQTSVQQNPGTEMQTERDAMRWAQSPVGVDVHESMSILMSRAHSGMDLAPGTTSPHPGAIDDPNISGQTALPYQNQNPSMSS